VKLFAHLRTTQTFRRQHLHFLETEEDQDIILEVGLHQERGKPLTLRQLQFLGIASIPTLQRRLRQLRQIGAIVARRREHDRRAVELRLSPRVMRTYARYVNLLTSMRRNGAEHPAAGSNTAL